MFFCKTVMVNGRRTSVRLLRQTWVYINDLYEREHNHSLSLFPVRSGTGAYGVIYGGTHVCVNVLS